MQANLSFQTLNCFLNNLQSWSLLSELVWKVKTERVDFSMHQSHYDSLWELRLLFSFFFNIFIISLIFLTKLQEPISKTWISISSNLLVRKYLSLNLKLPLHQLLTTSPVDWYWILLVSRGISNYCSYSDY
jgi:hypothetical protein